MNDSEYLLFTPEVFKQPGLEHLVYLETRSQEPTNSMLSGNVGETQPVYNLENYRASGSTDSFEEWERKARLAAAERLDDVRTHLGLDEIALLRVGHGVSIADLSDASHQYGQSVAFNDKPEADVSLVTRPGSGSVIAPADCVVATIAYPNIEAVAQIHSGIRGMVKGVIPLTLELLKEKGLDPTSARVYLSPHARNFILDDQERKEMSELIRSAPEEIRDEYNAYTAENEHKMLTMNLTQFTLRQLMRSGIQSDHVEVSPVDTFADPNVYSHYRSINQTGQPNGRIAVAVGIKAPQDNTVQ